MLQHLTWNQFFLAAAVCLLLYYLTVMLLCYRQELKALLEKTKDRLLPKVYLISTTSEPAPTGTATASPIGAVSTSDAPELSDASAIVVAPQTIAPVNADDAPENKMTSPATTHTAFPMGTLADLLEEVKSLLELVSETKMEKEEFSSLLQLIISKYSRTAQGQYLYKVQRFILEESKEKLPFGLTSQDLQALWPNN